jgi:hypothetical protein
MNDTPPPPTSQAPIGYEEVARYANADGSRYVLIYRRENGWHTFEEAGGINIVPSRSALRS